MTRKQDNGLPALLIADRFEKAVVGEALYAADALGHGFNLAAFGELGLEPQHFRLEWLGDIWEAVLGLAAEGKAPTRALVADVLERRGLLDSKDTENLRDAWSPGGAEWAVPRIKEAAERRRLLTLAGAHAELACEEGELGDLRARMVAGVLEGERREGGQSPVLMHGATQAFVFDRLEELERRSKQAGGVFVNVPWAEVNEMVGTLRGGHLYLLAGKTRHGKTVALEQIAEWNAERGFQVAFFHLELSHQWMLWRRVMRLTGAHVYELERGERAEEAMAAEEQVNGWTGGEHFIHCPGWPADRIAARAGEMAAAGLADLVVVDYLQKLRLERVSGWNRAAQIGQAVEVLKTMGERLGVPVLLGSQVSRLEGRPHLHNIRDSGEVEEKVNHACFLYRKEDSFGGLAEDAEFYQEKPTGGKTMLYFEAERLRFLGEREEIYL